MKEALQFYIDNDLNEAISEKSQNYFLQKDIPKKNVEKKAPEVQIKTIEKPIIKPIFSTSDALGQLAKKSQNMSNQNQEFLSLNEIIAKAKKIANACQNLDELRSALEKFDGCNLKKMATNLVFADGNPKAKVMVIGEAPGNNEDLQGIPFCGDSGKLLDEIFRSIDLSRKENLYITNVIFWRPPGNRRPTDEELAICKPFVERHIQLVDPKVIVLVGATSMAAILENNEPVSKIRGQLMDFSASFLPKKIKTFAIFHPSYLLRQPSKKRIAWVDMLTLEKFLK